MMPVTMSPSRPAYSSYFISRSTSRRRCIITCLKVWAAMRPRVFWSGVTSSSGPNGSPSSLSSCAVTCISAVTGSMVAQAYS
jgi:hypothetical protein